MTTTVPVPTELTRLITDVLQVDPALVTPEATLVDLGCGSAQEIELFVAIEDRYRITLDYQAFADLRTVGELAATIGAASR